MLASDAYRYQRTEVHGYYMGHPYGTLSPCARTSGSVHIVTQCFSFGDSLYGLPTAILWDLQVLASVAYRYQRTEVPSYYMGHPYGICTC